MSFKTTSPPKCKQAMDKKTHKEIQAFQFWNICSTKWESNQFRKRKRKCNRQIPNGKILGLITRLKHVDKFSVIGGKTHASLG